MAIDPEMNELAQALRQVNEEAQKAGVSLRRLPTGGTGSVGTSATMFSRTSGTTRDSFKQQTLFGDRSWRENRKDARDLADVAVGAARGDAEQIANGITGLLPRRAVGGFIAVQAIRYGTSELVANMKEVYEENKRYQDILTAGQKAGVISKASEGRAIQAIHLEQQMGKMNRVEQFIGGPGVVRDSIATPINFLSGLLGFEALATSRDIQQKTDKATQESLEKVEKLQDDYYKNARLGNLVDAGSNIGGIAKEIGTAAANRWQKNVGSPGEVFYRYDVAKTQNRLWSAMQSPRAGPRSDVD